MLKFHKLRASLLILPLVVGLLLLFLSKVYLFYEERDSTLSAAMFGNTECFRTRCTTIHNQWTFNGYRFERADGTCVCTVVHSCRQCVCGWYGFYERYVGATSRSDTRYNSINSYAMLHVRYRLNMFGGKVDTEGRYDKKWGNRDR